MEYMRLNNLLTKKRDLFSSVLEIEWAVQLRDVYKDLLWMASPWWPQKLEMTW